MLRVAFRQPDRVQLLGGADVLFEVGDGVVEVDAVLLEEGVNLHAGFVAEQDADLVFAESLGAVALDGEGLERGLRRALAGGDELRGERVRNVERHLHRLRIARARALDEDRAAQRG